MDEPLSNLDAKLREALRIELEHIQKTQHSTTLYVTHDQVEALTLADRIAVLRQGRIVQIGAPQDIYDRPSSVFVAQLVGAPRINLLAAAAADGEIRVTGSELRLPLGPTANGLPASFTLGVRPEDVQPAGNGVFSGQVALIEPLGVETIWRTGVSAIRCDFTSCASGCTSLIPMVGGSWYNDHHCACIV
jgi:multiple sugar transport system ATP-binding protein